MVAETRSLHPIVAMKPDIHENTINLLISVLKDLGNIVEAPWTSVTFSVVLKAVLGPLTQLVLVNPNHLTVGSVAKMQDCARPRVQSTYVPLASSLELEHSLETHGSWAKNSFCIILAPQFLNHDVSAISS